MSLIHHVLLWEAKLKILARKRKALNIGGGLARLTFGVANGIHSSIVNSEVTLDNLFQE